MLPSILSRQLKKGLKDYIEATFPMTNRCFKGTLDQLLKTKDSVYHEPYISVKMPFRTSHIETDFEGIKLSYQPYLHQSKAFQRLAIPEPKATIIATGTGSGKTECFMYPALEYCYKNRGTKGIKVLIIYPMNALATDQARRMAKEIYQNPKLKGNITVGMYVGGEEQGKSSMVMGKETVITDHETLLSNPPDILLTNYKMLDYLLVRPKDASLWKENKAETLKYIMVDELHTFDGAQGTDLACLLRRLKARLSTPKDYICSVGTSATIGNKENISNILNYASEIFGEKFEEDAIITEDRLQPEEFFKEEISEFKVPTNDEINAIYEAYQKDNFEDFIKLSVKAWFESFDENIVFSEKGKVELGKRLLRHNFTISMLSFMKNRYVQNSFIIQELKNSYPFLTQITENEFAIDTLFALISYARKKEGNQIRPFLTVSVQLWIRELRRVVGKVSDTKIEYALATDLNKEQASRYLPVINCRDCGFTGWASIIDAKQNIKIRDLDAFYNEFFNYDDNILFIYPEKHENAPDDFYKGFVCPACLQVDLGEGESHICSACGSNSFPIILPKEIKTRGNHKHYVCPHCKSSSSLSLLGLRSATAISATVSQMFSSKFNDDKKTLTFSDNVQDAAHRAGFFNSRTWKFSLRSAIQKFVEEKEKEMSLYDFQNEFIHYWKSKLTKEEYVSLFIPPNLTWMDSYEEMKENGKLPQNPQTNTLIEYIDNRLKYEILLEYGLTARIGRTLEKTYSSILSFQNDKIKIAAKMIHEKIYNEFGKTIDNAYYEKMILSTLNQLKYNGAFCDSAYDYYIENGCSDYLLSNSFRSWMPGKNSSRNTPEFLYKQTGIPEKNKYKNLCHITNETSSYKKAIQAILPDGIWGEDIIQTIFETMIDALKNQAVLLEKKPNENTWIYGINTKMVTISNKIQIYKCKKCGQYYSFSIENSKLADDLLCPSNHCYGNLEKEANLALDYYHNLYCNGDIKRIIAEEHTGLLDRSKREEVEKIFKHTKEEQKPWDTNLLSCTPTLEMGIDIGDLSSVILCSMPPAQSKYLQRVGRAGRKDGNALIITVANARPHDLYFYASPLEMIEGEVDTPKIFLDASAVLERQFVAFCFDNWVKSGIAENAIPKTIRTCLNKLDSKDTAIFPYNFLKYTQERLSKLLTNFFKLFPEISDVTKGEIYLFAKGTGLENSPMYLKIFENFETLKKQKNSITDNIKDLTIQIEKIKSMPYDSSYEEEKKELDAEKKALGQVVKNMTRKNVFNFLSDEGLLPNYAFPEDGITLKAILRKKDEKPNFDTQKKKYNHVVYEFNRPSSTAISEFAPLNNFYASGRKLTIDQVDLVSAHITAWRLCPNCSHAEIEVEGKHTSCCPQCGTPGWADKGQVRSMLKAQMVYSNMDYNQSKIDDESDDRKVTFYNKQLLVDVKEEEDIQKAYRMDNNEFPFGFEYIKKATIREINFGESNLSGEKFYISGVESIRKGFRICKYCGKIQAKEGKGEHTYSCKAKSTAYHADDYEDCLFLYRELQTEALRLLLPSTTLDTTKVKVESFEAAFMLGMKEYFGNVDHLKTCVCEAPVQGSEYRKQYLVIYDSVPGGTGYLKQLLQNDNFLIDVFQKSIHVMENCSCKDDLQKDGCYHCLYGYRQSRNIGSISRIAALNMFRQIVSGKDNLQVINSINNIPVNSLADSELEMMFIEALSLLKSDKRELTIHKDFVNNKEGYILKIGNCRWEIEPQVRLGKEQNVSVTCQPDFIMWPRKGCENQLPIAIFTDGFTFHKNKTADDTLKREAIRQSGKYRVWSLTFKDVQDKFKSQGNYMTNTLLPEKMPSGAIMYQKMLKEGDYVIKPSKVSPLELLAEYLETNHAEEIFKHHATAYSWSLLDTSRKSDQAAYALWNEEISQLMKSIEVTYPKDFEDTIFGTWIPKNVNSALNIYAGIHYKTKEPSQPYVYAELHDDLPIKDEHYEKEWNGFWNFYNVMQFSPYFYGLTTTGIHANVYDVLSHQEIVWHEAEKYPANMDEKWQEVLNNIYDETAIQFVKQCIENKIPIPDEVGYELYEKGFIIGECELLWSTPKMVYLTEKQIKDSEKAFKNHGYSIVKSITDAIRILRGGK